MSLSKNALDVSKIFLAYTAFAGDPVRTAHAMELPMETVRDLAKEEGWDAKLKELNRASGDSREVSVQINRAVNFVQAHRTRSVLDKILNELVKMEGPELLSRLTVEGKNGSEVKLRPLTDLVKAIETAQLMTARALGDTADERPKEEHGPGGSAIALQVLHAMNAAKEIGVDSVEIVKQQIAQECGKNA
jgi:hypothetical protein